MNANCGAVRQGKLLIHDVMIKNGVYAGDHIRNVRYKRY